ncbi:MAG: PKD domain-containing protein, partial [Lamprobacter sp.]|uniref:PKD domain-containing protein n=1 Tax=Lamprobacter sp. TaxID=3100796 RepID=UPI002B256EED
MAGAPASIKWLGTLVVLAMILSGWGLRTESASPGVTAHADVSTQVATAFTDLRFNPATQTFDRVATLTNTSADPIQAPLALHITDITPASVTLDNPSGIASDEHPYVAVPLPTGELAPGTTVTDVVLRFRNPSGVSFTFTDSVLGTEAADNSPPVANAGPDQTASVADTVTLDGSGSTDPEGDKLSAVWTLLRAPAGSTAFLSDPTAINPRLTLDQAGTYVVQLIVNDGQADSAPDSLTISTDNTPPVANPGRDRTAPLGATLTLNGSGSSDVDGDPLTFAWTLVRQPEGSTAELLEVDAIAPQLALDQPGAYVVQLIVNDGQADSAPASVTLATENSRPLADAGPAQTVPLGASVHLEGHHSTDADGDPLRAHWALTRVPLGSTATLSDPIAIDPTFVADWAGDYVAQLIVNDGTLNSTPVTVLISTDRSRPVADAGSDQEAVLGDWVFLDGSGSSDADGDPLSYRWSFTSRPDASEATLYDADQAEAAFVPDVAGLYVVQLIVSDGELASRPDTATLTLVVPESVNRARQATSSLVVMSATESDAATFQAESTPDPSGSARERYVTIFMQTLAGEGVILNDSLRQIFTRILMRQLNTDDAGRLIETATFEPLVKVFTFVASSPDQRPSSPSAYTPAAVEAARRAAQGLQDVTDPPPDPETIAPAVNPSVSTTTFAATEFLYTGNNPIQTGVAPGTIEAKRAAVIRGRVLDKSDAPLADVTITIQNHPEYGQTLSRADGWFDLAVNGGGDLTLNYMKTDYLTVQRQADVPWQDSANIDDVVMLARDPQVTEVTFGQAAPIQVARGSLVTDESGSRRATLVIPAGTTAEVYNADGTTRAADVLHVRLTEYTVGDNGPESMPATLPGTSAYTYAVELSADEAPIKINGKDVLFNQPVYLYLENFIGFPTGIQVPMAYYDRDQAAWVPTPDGRVIK